MIQLMRMVISIFNYKMQKPARSFHPMLNCASFFGVGAEDNRNWFSDRVL